MKLRKHIRNSRLESLNQMGNDRVIDLFFTTGTDNYHIIVELYDRGNVILTDGQYIILSLLRTRKDGEETRFAVREMYPVDKITPPDKPLTLERIQTFVSELKPGADIKKSLNHHLSFGGYLIEHCLLQRGMNIKCKLGNGFNPETDVAMLFEALLVGEAMMKDSEKAKGYVFKKTKTFDSATERLLGEEQKDVEIMDTFQPFLFLQYESSLVDTYDTFNRAVDCFFSRLEESKICSKTFTHEKAAFKKLTNIRKDHDKRIGELENIQESNLIKATLIQKNLELVDKVIELIRDSLSDSMDWSAIEKMIRDAQENTDTDPAISDPAKVIRKLDLHHNHVFIYLTFPEESESSQSSSESDEEELGATPFPKSRQSSGRENGMLVDIDVTLTAYANISRYYKQKKQAFAKQQKTTAASGVALKSAERKTKIALKQVQTIALIKKVRKTYWFEKFYWFISSDNYLVIGGRDRQQNEIIVKKHLVGGDVYIHADVHGSSSVVVKNPSGSPIPPRTLHEAGTFVICHSAAWDEKIITSAYWVNPDQVSKTTPSGQYIQTGSFMIRGKKNYLPHSYLVFGIGILFKIDDSCVDNHLHERQPKLGEIADIVPETPTEEKEFPLNQFEDALSSSEEDIQPEEAAPISSKIVEINEYDFPDTMLDVSTSISGIVQKKTNIIEDIPDSSDKSVKFNTDPVSSISVESEDGSLASTTLTKGQPQMTRAQRRKLKKTKKYADQDEEERVEAIQLLTSTGDAKPRGKKKKRGCASSSRQAHFQNNLQHNVIPLSEVTEALDSGSDDNIVVPKPKTPSELIQDQETARLIKQMNVLNRDQNPSTVPQDNQLADKPDNDDEDITAIDEFAYLNTLTAQPLEDDIILYAVVTCAPYATLVNSKYKAKLTPGSGKKGKALQAAFTAFASSSNVTQTEKEHIKCLRDTDVSYLMPGKKVNISIIGTGNAL
ncbi:Nuclear export mediator factor NEMF-like [Oopsacas minuta]|uniref:Nuclear export mediator factor NEMF-like n=1 Tax=Oopsacas minuta TaxID=111878 RepID=A0AAV7K9U8_9METZ|nr:Nuclear export mediator factor NEMF-like [Oopsacas minuta]